MVGGHRGHLSETRENTISNFTGLLNSGIEYIKIDIQLTRDDEAVIFHDRELSKKTPLNGYVRNYSLLYICTGFLRSGLSLLLYGRQRYTLQPDRYSLCRGTIARNRLADVTLLKFYCENAVLYSIQGDITLLLNHPL